MPFTTGLLSGAALTTGLLYLTLSTHRVNRAHQASLLKQQDILLRELTDPAPQLPSTILQQRRQRDAGNNEDATAALGQREHEEFGGVTEMAKDRWNRELARSVHAASEVDWAGVWDRFEFLVRRLGNSAAGIFQNADPPDSGKKGS